MRNHRKGSVRTRCAAVSAMVILVASGCALATRIAAAGDAEGDVLANEKFPVRVHVFEDYETEIEKRWWLRGTPSEGGVPTSRSASVPNRRMCEAAESHDFDDKMGDPDASYNAVVFNPVPGPPMGNRTRLAFRYRIAGTTTLRVQIYSLTNNYHRRLELKDLPEGEWRSAVVDMTLLRRPDGSGGPLSRDERIDDIQFYVSPDAKVAIDDIVLYEAAADDEMRFFPRRIIFTGWFDTGEQGKEWPGEFEIVPHEKPRTWDAAQSVVESDTGRALLVVNLRGRRRLSAATFVFFRYRLRGEGPIRVVLADSERGEVARGVVREPARDEWGEATLVFEVAPDDDGELPEVDEIRFVGEKEAVLLVDDLLVFEPGG